MSLHVTVALPSTNDPLTRELGQMLAADLRQLGAIADAIPDEDVGVADMDLLVIFGDIIYSARALASLRGNNRRPRAIVWQLEPVPPASHFTSDVRGTFGARVLYGTERMAIRHLRPFVPRSVRSKLLRGVRSVAWRAPMREAPAKDQPDGYWGHHRVERVRAIKATHEEGLINTVFAGTPERAEAIGAAGIPCSYLSVGYHDAMDPPKGLQRDIDALFLGRPTVRREEVIERLKKDFRDRGLNLHVEQGPIYGEARARLLGRSKVSLHIGHLDHEIPRIRPILSMAAGALFISEKRGSTAPFEDGKHMVTAPVEAIAEMVEHYARHEDERRAITDAARTLVSEQVTMKQSARVLLKI